MSSAASRTPAAARRRPRSRTARRNSWLRRPTASRARSRHRSERAPGPADLLDGAEYAAGENVRVGGHVPRIDHQVMQQADARREASVSEGLHVGGTPRQHRAIDLGKKVVDLSLVADGHGRDTGNEFE